MSAGAAGVTRPKQLWLQVSQRRRWSHSDTNHALVEASNSHAKCDRGVPADVALRPGGCIGAPVIRHRLWLPLVG